MSKLSKFLSLEEVEFCKQLHAKYEKPNMIRSVIPMAELGVIETRIKETVTELYGPCLYGAEVENVNILRYPTGTSMPMHKDINAVSKSLKDCKQHLFLSICLSEDFTGGILINDNVFCDKQTLGDGMIFDGDKFHMVTQILSGERIVLIVYIHTLT